jgi:hypothetical protein
MTRKAAKLLTVALVTCPLWDYFWNWLYDWGGRH